MITEKDVPTIKKMALAIRSSLLAGRPWRRREDWPLLARVMLHLEKLCDRSPPPLKSIEQTMQQAMELRGKPR